jgi:integrase
MNLHPVLGPDGRQARGANGKPLWRLEFSAGRDGSTGRYRRVTERFAGTRHQAEERWHARRAELDAAARAGAFVRPLRETVQDYLNRWLADTGPGVLKPKTLSSYLQVTRLYLAPSLGALPLADLSPRHVEEALGRLVRPKDQGGAGVSARTAALAHAVLRRVLADAVRRGDLARNAAGLARAPRGESRRVTGYSLSDMRALGEAARGHRLEALFLLAWTGGLRMGELLALRWTDLDLGAGTVAVGRSRVNLPGPARYTSPKTAAGRRVVVLPQQTVEALEAHRGRQVEERRVAGARWQDHGLVFCTRLGGPLSPRNLDRLWRTLRDKAGLQPPQGFHSLRHTYGALALSAGVPLEAAAEALGHRDIGFTKRVYADVLLDLKRAAAERFARYVATGEVALRAEAREP